MPKPTSPTQRPLHQPSLIENTAIAMFAVASLVFARYVCAQITPLWPTWLVIGVDLIFLVAGVCFVMGAVSSFLRSRH